VTQDAANNLNPWARRTGMLVIIVTGGGALLAGGTLALLGAT